MDYRRLGYSEMKVSALGLGGNSFGWKIDAPAAARIIDAALDAGINYIDTADMYDNGRSEEFIGAALKGRRGRVLIGTKFGSGDGVRMVFPEGKRHRGGSRPYIEKAVDASLKRLQTDYIDLYQLHDPDPETPLEETLRALDDLVKAGKVRYLGCCDFDAWQLCEATWTSRIHKLQQFVSVQRRYNLLDRRVEVELAGYCREYGVGLIPWGPLAGGFLTGKYPASRQRAELFGRDRETLIEAVYGDVPTEANWNKVARLEKFAAACGHTVGELALAWLISRPWVGMVCPSATSTKQLAANMKALEWRLSREEIEGVEKIAPVIL